MIDAQDNPKKGKHSLASKKDPLVSIVMPVFNVGPYLDACFISVLSQPYKNFELIVIDDASTDNGRAIIDMYSRLDTRIKVVHLEYNTLGGAGIPSNIGINMANGKYLAFVDSDDWVSPGALGDLMSTAEQFDADVVIGDFFLFQEDTREVKPAYDKAAWARLPRNEIISADAHPDLFRLSPVPWRKLYKTEFLRKNAIHYPEGDYFYEDNPLHWRVLANASRVVLVDTPISYHRMARPGQTMSASSYKLAAMCSHINTIGNYLHVPSLITKQNMIDEFYDYCYRSIWVASDQSDGAVKSIIEKRLSNIYLKQSKIIPPKKLRKNFEKVFTQFHSSYADLDLTIVIPVHNCHDLIGETIASVYQMKNISFNVLLIDDGSTDNTVEVCEQLAKTYPNLHFFQQGNKGAGRARNSLIPLCTGTYTFFLDADDVISGTALEQAVVAAISENSDLYFVKYKIEFTDENRTRGMFDADAKLWANLAKTTTNCDRREIVAGLINYPWNRIIATQLLHDENIFFGPTVVHNDIPFHWHSIAAAKKIGFSELEVCTHKKFNERQQITNINDHRRMMVFEALRVAQERIRAYPSLNEIKGEWETFARHVVSWARTRVNTSNMEMYNEKAKVFLDDMAKKLDKAA